MGQTGEKKYTVFVNAEMEIVFFFGFIIFYFYFILCILDGGLQKRHVTVTSLGRCCRHSGGALQSPDCWSSCSVRGKMREGEVDYDKGMVNDVKGVQNLGGREILSCMRKGISVCVLVVVLMVVVGVLELMIVLKVVCLGAVGEDCSGVIDTFVLGGDFVVVLVGVELVVRCAMKLVLWCSNGRGDFL